ncbi:phosphatidylglycerophosphatase A family protein [Candidatus Desulfovibrio trichonymphae]|uniref:Phosphatidylglycerophosphatase A n=1 Tax=Candidatus Desulfovibrio trichonymphae TaxID=1725232 RepID=A0A1J1E3N0_9BACT|nr:phosphatidylglycerophosphatase A [Candidatus Desulfovibrio trichonymphae]BAV92515.1 phosphatidylglycerophosphatase A [Candidatus Desulfovibrio trichonymphae]GHU98742.1 phosphatidylglycerophosphatase A [Deltaproteobacteria bacterium]
MRFQDMCVLAFCRLGVAGLAPKAPGTWGSAVACLLAPFVFLPFSYTGRVLALVLIFIAGGLAAMRAEQLLGRKDPGEVVIDELLGVWIALSPFEKPGPGIFVASFALFRLFDIWKPWPVRASENWLPDGFGVMLDDAFAGLWALLCVLVLHFLHIV